MVHFSPTKYVFPSNAVSIVFSVRLTCLAGNRELRAHFHECEYKRLQKQNQNVEYITMSDVNSYLLEDCPLGGALEVQPLKKNVFFGHTSNE